MNDYPSNSKLSKSERTRFKKVINSDVKVSSQKSRLKISDVFSFTDLNSIGYSLAKEILIPSVKKAIYELITNGSHMFLYGDTAPAKPKGSVIPGAKIAYQNFYSSGTNKNNQISSRITRQATYSDYDEFEYNSKQEAEMVLDIMNEAIETYGKVSILDMYDMVGVTSSHASDNYGWTNLSKAYSERTLDGKYILKLPKVESLK